MANVLLVWIFVGGGGGCDDWELEMFWDVILEVDRIEVVLEIWGLMGCWSFEGDVDSHDSGEVLIFQEEIFCLLGEEINWLWRWRLRWSRNFGLNKKNKRQRVWRRVRLDNWLVWCFLLKWNCCFIKNMSGVIIIPVVGPGHLYPLWFWQCPKKHVVCSLHLVCVLCKIKACGSKKNHILKEEYTGLWLCRFSLGEIYCKDFVCMALIRKITLHKIYVR